MVVTNEEDDATLVDINYQQTEKDDSEDDTEGIKFWTIWLSSGLIITVIFFLIAYNVVEQKASQKEHSVRTVPSHSTKLSALVIYIRENHYNSEIIRRWKDLLQSWALYSPCTAFSKPINWECSNVDLIIYASKNDLREIKEETVFCFTTMSFSLLLPQITHSVNHSLNSDWNLIGFCQNQSTLI
jgi:hypothetical protein